MEGKEKEEKEEEEKSNFQKHRVNSCLKTNIIKKLYSKKAQTPCFRLSIKRVTPETGDCSPHYPLLFLLILKVLLTLSLML